MFRVVFFGTAEFSVPSLKALINDPRFSVSAVVTQPNKKIGRHQKPSVPAVKKIAEEHNIPVFQPESLKNIEDLPECDVAVIVSYGKILPKKILDYPKNGCVNVHGSLLPRWRGASCVQSAIAAGDPKSGVTIMKLDEKMDHGPILAQKEIPLTFDETGQSLHDKLAKLGGETLPNVLANYLEDRITPSEQNHSQATTCPLLKREDGLINWSQSATEIERKIRAYDPWPGTYTIQNDKRLKILTAKIAETPIMPPNASMESFVISDKKLFAICGNKSILQILTLQPEGKKPMSAAAFISGHPTR